MRKLQGIKRSIIITFLIADDVFAVMRNDSIVSDGLVEQDAVLPGVEVKQLERLGLAGLDS